jgi:hypothetical protein
MSTVMEIKMAIERLSAAERAELDALVWPQSGASQADEPDMPPRVREKLAAAATGRFLPGNRTNIEKILASLE